MKSSQFELSILVDNKPITEYADQGSIFVEGRSGSEYTLRMRNNSSDRAVFVLSVDGLSILNGQECSDNSPGYLVPAWQTLDVACYKVDDSTGAKFVFGTKEKSYSAEVGKGTVNVGVIAAAVFREQYQPMTQVYYSGCFSSPKSPMRSHKSVGADSATKGWQGSGSVGDSSWATNSVQFGSNAAGAGSLGQSVDSSITCSNSAPVEQELGTVFGDAMAWKTQTVDFKRQATPACHLVIYYDSRKNLERRGIKLEHKVPPLPNPFPANGCPTPSNWHK